MVKHYTVSPTPQQIRESYNTQSNSSVQQFYGFISQEITGAKDNSGKPSSQVSDFYVPYVVPPFGSFIQCQEYYRTIGKVQNVIDSMVANIINREWYFESDKPSRVKAMEDWEEKFNLSDIIEHIVRDWLMCGNSILGFSDWQPMQLSTILGMKRDIYGVPEYFVQTVNGKVVDIQAKPFLFTKFIEINRDAWGIPLFGSLIASNYTDIDGKQPLPMLQVYRQMLLDSGRIYHKYASPRAIWSFPDANKEVLEKDIKPLMDAMRPGDRLALNTLPTLVTEQIEFRNRFDVIVKMINDETEAGLQSSTNRLITQPSAMADAKEAGAQDDDRVLGIMEKLRRVINKFIIPRVIGEANVCFFKWGSKDTIELEFPEGLLNAVQMGVISLAEARMILSIKGWKLDDGLFQQDVNQQVFQLQQMIKRPDVQQALSNAGIKLPGMTATPQKTNDNIDQVDTKDASMTNTIPYRDTTLALPAGDPVVPAPNKTKPQHTGA